MHFSRTLFPVNFFNISTLEKGGGARPSAPRRGAPSRKNLFFAYKKSGWQKKPKPPKNQKKSSKSLETFFHVFLTFFQISSRTWGINFDTIACLFELVYGPKKNYFFRPKFYFPKYFRGTFPLLSSPQKWSKNIWKIYFFHPILPYFYQKSYFKGLTAQRGLHNG